MKILIIKTSAFGDIIHALPALDMLQQSCPNMQIDWLVKQLWQGLLADNEYIDHLYALPKGLLDQISLISYLHKQDYDYIIDLQGLLKTSLYAYLIAGDNTIIWGKNNNKEKAAKYLYQAVYDNQPQDHIICQNIGLVQAFLESIDRENQSPSQPDIRQQYHGLLASSQRVTPKPYMVYTSQTTWTSKTYRRHEELLALLQSHCQEKGYELILLGGKAESSPASIINLTGQTTLADLFGILAAAQAVIAPDTGILHLADVFQTPCLGIYGATDPARNGAYWGQNIQAKNCPHQPCHKRQCLWDKTDKQYLSCLDILPADILQLLQYNPGKPVTKA